MKKIVWLIIAFLALATTTHGNNIENVSFKTVAKGTYSPTGEEVDNKQRIVEIYNHSEWISFWKWHIEAIKSFPEPKMPEIDFSIFIVVVAIDQIRGSGGYSIQIKEVTVDTALKNRVWGISSNNYYPGSAAVTPSVMSRPYHIIKFKK